MKIALFTGGGDRPYALGIAAALSDVGVSMDFIGSDYLRSEQHEADKNIRFLNLKGDQNPNVSKFVKITRITIYYYNILKYSLTTKVQIFHLLWNNKFQLVDRVFLMLLYRILGKKILFTAHNVNAGKRDGNDSFYNRLTLKIQYRLCAYIFVHTNEMKQQLLNEFGVKEKRAIVIPFGLNSTVPDRNWTRDNALEHLDLTSKNKKILFFGNITAYKGLEYLVNAYGSLFESNPEYRLIIAGNPKGEPEYWQSIDKQISVSNYRDSVRLAIEYVPDEETEIYFKAADVLVLPYTHIFQSGVLFLAYNFGLPVIATDVGSLKEDVVEGERALFACPRIRRHSQNAFADILIANFTEILN